MTVRGTRPADGAPRGTVHHVPVLLPQVLAALAPKPGERFIDGTYGAGGYADAILGAAPGVRVLGLDRDPAAIAAGHAAVARQAGRLILVEGRFGEIERIAGEQGFAPADGIVLDIGVSSMQLDDPARGFSFQSDGPLDMRMSAVGPTAAEVVNTAEEGEIADILFHLGEERSARGIARRIVARRGERPFARTKDLADLVVRVLGRESIAGRHAATRTFQALRMYVNDELGELARALVEAERILAPRGRLAVVSFHSLEDRLIKRFLKERGQPEARGSRHLPPQAGHGRRPSFLFVNQAPVSPTQEEIAANRRARSAKLRAVIRTDAPAWDQDFEELDFPRP
jgi:16S rRNA (cytosine1402-N4)-methyltransferase